MACCRARTGHARLQGHLARREQRAIANCERWALDEMWERVYIDGAKIGVC
jgi:hypothetical protein